MARPEVSDRVDRVGWIAAAALAATVFGMSWLRHSRYWSGFDLAIFDQGAWQLSEGRTHISLVERHVLADHFSPIFLPFGLAYRLVATPLWLLGAQAVAIGVTVLPTRRLARHVGAEPTLATWLVVASAPLLAAAAFDFHPSTLAVPMVAACVAAAVADRPGSAVAWAVAVGLCRADLGLVVLAIALVAGRRSRAPVAVAGVVIAAVGAVAPGWFGATSGWLPHFGHVGPSPLDALLHPWDLFAELLSPSAIGVLLVWVLAVGGGVLFQPRWMAALVLAGLPILLSRWVGTELPWYHYGAPMAPLAIGGTLVTLGQRTHRGDLVARRLRAAVIVGPVAALLLASPLAPTAPDSNRIWSFVVTRPGTDPAAAVATIDGADTRVSAADHLLPHLSHREHLYLYPIPFAPAPEFFAVGSEPALDQYDDDTVSMVIAPTGYEDFAIDAGFSVVEEVDGFVVLQRADAEP